MERNDILEDLKTSKEHKYKWTKQAKEDYEFVVGDQWDDDDRNKLESEGKPALTLNKIQALVFLISGIQRQNRTDYHAFPIGEEDTIKADAITHLIKDMMRNCDGDYKESEMFENGIICGEGWVEPYLDYGKDIMNGDLMFRDCSPLHIFVDPASKEYDHSDARFIIKYTPNITKEQVLQLFPDEEATINKIAVRTFSSEDAADNVVVQVETDDYPMTGDENDEEINESEVLDYDMTEYHYYKQEPIYIIVNTQNKEEYFTYDKKEEANAVLAEKNTTGLFQMVKRFIQVPRISVLVNGHELDDYVNQFYPRYRKITLIAFYAHKTKAPIRKKELLVQGIVNSLKDPQREINKRRSQELHHLNTSTNSGWLNNEKNGFTDLDAVEAYGSTPGIVLNFKGEKPERIFPMALSSGHEALAELANKDIKEISGVNTDLLAQNDKASSSGRAIHLRQQQGLMMIQRILDNFSRTKRELGRFLISQIGEVFTNGKAKRAIGEAWIKEHFSEPVMTIRKDPHTGEVIVDPQSGKPEQVPVMKPNGQMVTEVDEEGATAFIQMILDNSGIDRYDVSVGEVATSETIKMANYAMMLEFIQAGVPIPPDVIIEESMMSEQAKNKIKRSFAARQQVAAQAAKK